MSHDHGKPLKPERDWFTSQIKSRRLSTQTCYRPGYPLHHRRDTLHPVDRRNDPFSPKKILMLANLEAVYSFILFKTKFGFPVIIYFLPLGSRRPFQVVV